MDPDCGPSPTKRWSKGSAIVSDMEGFCRSVSYLDLWTPYARTVEVEAGMGTNSQNCLERDTSALNGDRQEFELAARANWY